ncbi:threonylcarbamoyl-AMP synthase-like [Artemia franciscana]|uniref:Threonylcarbamoyl-AMP synthase n=1 Tax=Artemia franciscana TaxID=6661 RepID=A0AA88I2C8_ARTSF|nr:hypothetical protein QYM36_005825 [Artemia franciscana]
MAEMKPIICRIPSIVDKEKFMNCVAVAADLLKRGGIIAIPTDTIYGIAALAQSIDSVERLYKIKGREHNKPIAICVGELNDIPKWGKVDCPIGLISALLPGPVTLLFNRHHNLNPLLNPDGKLVGIRIPDHSFVRALAKECNEPIALTSANVSGSLSTLSIEEFSELWPLLDGVFDGGRIVDTPEARKGSTIVDLSLPGAYKIIREGSAYKKSRATIENFGLIQEAI